MVTVEKLKAYLRIDTEYEDSLLEGFLSNATGYLKGAVTNYAGNYLKYSEFAEKADLLTLVIAAELYQNRENSLHDMSYTIRTLIMQLEYFIGEESVSSIDTVDVASDTEADKYFESIFGGSDTKVINDDEVATNDEANEYFDRIFGGN